MIRAEFTQIMAYISVVTGKPIGATDKEAELRMNAYFDLLGDLTAEVLQAAARKVCLEHKWASFPQVAELREAAAKVVSGTVGHMTAGEAWDQAYRAACAFIGDIEGTWSAGDRLWNSELEYRESKLEPRVLAAVRAMGGLRSVRDSDAEFARKEFARVWADLEAREKELALLPPKVRADIERLRHQPEANGRLEAAKEIGRMPE